MIRRPRWRRQVGRRSESVDCALASRRLVGAEESYARVATMDALARASKSVVVGGRRARRRQTSLSLFPTLSDLCQVRAWIDSKAFEWQIHSRRANRPLPPRCPHPLRCPTTRTRGGGSSRPSGPSSSSAYRSGGARLRSNADLYRNSEYKHGTTIGKPACRPCWIATPPVCYRLQTVTPPSKSLALTKENRLTCFR